MGLGYCVHIRGVHISDMFTLRDFSVFGWIDDQLET